MAAVVPLKNDNSVSNPKIGTRLYLHDSANPLVPQVLGVVMKLKIMLRPNAAALKANRRNFGFHHSISRLDDREWSLYQLERPRPWYRQRYI